MKLFKNIVTIAIVAPFTIGSMNAKSVVTKATPAVSQSAQASRVAPALPGAVKSFFHLMQDARLKKADRIDNSNMLTQDFINNELRIAQDNNLSVSELKALLQAARDTNMPFSKTGTKTEDLALLNEVNKRIENAVQQL